MTRLARFDTSSQKECEIFHPYAEVTWFQSYQDHQGDMHRQAQICPPDPITLDRPSQFFATTPPPAQKLKETEEPDYIEVDLDPMDCHVFLASPIQTLVGSVQDAYSEHISLHDIADAYATLCLRIQDNAQTISRVGRALVALELLKAQASVVTDALRRDICRAFADPVPDTPSPTSSYISDSLMFPPSDPQPNFNEDEIKTARDQSHVCHHSLQFLSDILRFPTLQESFSIDQLGDLFDDILSIAFCTALPMLSSHKSILLCLWMLQTQQLSSQLLTSRNSKLAAGLRNLVDNQPSEFVLGSIKVICRLIEQQPAVYIPEFSDFLPQILKHLISPSHSILRHEVAHTLTALVQGFYTSTIACHVRTLISRHVLTFVDGQTAKGKPFTQPTLGLAEFVNGALDKPDEETKPQWAVTVVACIIVLSDASIFLHKRCLKFILPVLSKISVYKSRSIRAFHVPLWKCIVWALARLREVSENKMSKEGEGGAEFGDEINVVNVYNSAFHLSKEETKEDIGAAIVGVVLGRTVMHGKPADNSVQTADDVPKALSVIEELVQNKNNEQRWRVGMSLLVRLTSGIGSPSFCLDNGEVSESEWEWDYDALLVRELFDGSLLNAGRSHLQTLASKFQPIEVNTVRQLSEAEIVRYWDALLQIWVDCVNKSLTLQAMKLPAELIQIWQALLLCQTQLTQGLGHFTTPPEFAHKASSVLTDFLRPDNLLGLMALSRLTLATRLWGVMKNVFATAWLSITAESILCQLLTSKFDLLDDDIKVTWCALCSDLVSVGIPSISNGLFFGDRSDKRYTKRLVWAMVANRWRAYEDKSCWEVAADFLLIPLGLWNMSAYEDELWGTVLRSAVRMAAASSVRPVEVVQHIVEYIRSNNLDVHDLIGSMDILLSHVDLGDVGNFPVAIFTMVDQWLQQNYPPAGEERLSAACDVMQTLRHIMRAIPAAFIVPFLVSLRDGLCLWINDELETLEGSEYNHVIMSFYEDTLEQLKKLAPDIKTLHEVAPLLVSAFVRVPPPALGPMAFKRFWDTTYQGFMEPERYPPNIKDCLRGYHKAYGGDLPAGITIEDSQSTTDSLSVHSPITCQHPRPEGLRFPHPGKPMGSEEQIGGDAGSQIFPSVINGSFVSGTVGEPGPKRRKVSYEGAASTTDVDDREKPEKKCGSERAYRAREIEDTDAETKLGPVSDTDEYDDWETGLGSPDIRRLQRQLSSDVEVPDTEMSDISSSDAIMHNSRSGEHPLPRSQSQSSWYGVGSHIPPVRKSCTPPLLRQSSIASATTSVDFLRQAFDAMRTDTSQLSVADLIQASSMVQELQGLLQDKLKRKLQRHE